MHAQWDSLTLQRLLYYTSGYPIWSHWVRSMSRSPPNFAPSWSVKNSFYFRRVHRLDELVNKVVAKNTGTTSVSTAPSVLEMCD